MANKTTELFNLYKDIGQKVHHDCGSQSITDILNSISLECIRYLKRVNKKSLFSQIPDKKYFSFEIKKIFSRPVNAELWLEDVDFLKKFFIKLRGADLRGLSISDITKAFYTIAMGFCCFVDLNKSRDQKTPGTFFEYLIGHVFARVLGVNPRRQLEVLNLDMKSTLPTDFIFDLGPKKAKLHLPIKTSTRERVIQVWAHQRVLDGVYGTGRFRGTLVCLTETKMDRNSLEVIEICLPDQWRLYQMFIAQLTRVYYLDVPRRYEELNRVFPKITVAPFGQFFFELEALIS